MSDKNLAWLNLAVGLVGLYISFRVAMGLMQVQADANKTISDVKNSPLGGVLGVLGFK